MSVYGINAVFDEDRIHLDGDKMVGTWKDIWQKLKNKRTLNRIEQYKTKKMQSEIYKKLDNDGHEWLKCNIDPTKVAAIANMQEQMIETRAWKKNRGLTNETDLCRLCGKFSGVLHFASGCQLVVGSQYLTRHNNVLKILMTAWARQSTVA